MSGLRDCEHGFPQGYSKQYCPHCRQVRLEADCNALLAANEKSRKAFDSLEDSFLKTSKLLTEACMKNKSLYEQSNLWKAELKAAREELSSLHKVTDIIQRSADETLRALVAMTAERDKLREENRLMREDYGTAIEKLDKWLEKPPRRKSGND